ncbi:hypothetical protein SARC_01118 [Sphaeroforma arctica JP610]|uniref:Uncharacterized protein n=1 Tax=Sphaeroforma arctica JP610 TaxID=667725 RepID=A0A0L0GCV4_9EUKA|nr:hypothetical protein SARC_01118 [Sphaeroforma arctica JP610]KNC86739.1 hypothetical protein SARC_01118 [Sphaeroforma arctica JP610]|eukprot:XP_014160641.1 hypothetical protein SARC_01118 [Sphaeroforma arctica JP610]
MDFATQVENLRQRVRSGPARRSRRRLRKAEIDHFPALVGANKTDTPVFFAECASAAPTPTLQSLTYKKNYTNYCEAVECGIELTQAVADVQALVPRRIAPAFVPTSRHTFMNKHVAAGSKRTRAERKTRGEGMHIPCLKRKVPQMLSHAHIAKRVAGVSESKAVAKNTTDGKGKRATCFGGRPIHHKSLANQQLHDRIRRLKGVRSNAYSLGRSKLDRFLRTARRHQYMATMSMEPVWKTLALTWAYDQQRSTPTTASCASDATHTPINGVAFTSRPDMFC